MLNFVRTDMLDFPIGQTDGQKFPWDFQFEEVTTLQDGSGQIRAEEKLEIWNLVFKSFWNILAQNVNGKENMKYFSIK